MKTHEVSKKLEYFISQNQLRNDLDFDFICSLNHISLLLKNAPNVDIEETKIIKKTDNIAATLKALSSLSRYSKQQWIQVIKDFNFNIELNPRASSRDILGKVLAYLDENPDVLKKFEIKKNKPSSRNQEDSSLEDTLSKLINYK